MLHPLIAIINHSSDIVQSKCGFSDGTFASRLEADRAEPCETGTHPKTTVILSKKKMNKYHNYKYIYHTEQTIVNLVSRFNQNVSNSLLSCQKSYSGRCAQTLSYCLADKLLKGNTFHMIYVTFECSHSNKTPTHSVSKWLSRHDVKCCVLVLQETQTHLSGSRRESDDVSLQLITANKLIFSMGDKSNFFPVFTHETPFSRLLKMPTLHLPKLTASSWRSHTSKSVFPFILYNRFYLTENAWQPHDSHYRHFNRIFVCTFNCGYHRSSAEFPPFDVSTSFKRTSKLVTRWQLKSIENTEDLPRTLALVDITSTVTLHGQVRLSIESHLVFVRFSHKCTFPIDRLTAEVWRTVPHKLSFNIRYWLHECQ